MRGDKSPKPSDFWLKSYAMSFKDIVDKSNCSRRYVEYQYILKNKDICNNILKPVNDYAYNLYPRPTFVKYEDGFLYLRQRTHAEIWVRKDSGVGFYFLDRPHIRQFYPSLETLSSKDSFIMPHKFYIPWFFDLEKKFNVLQVTDEYCPFVIKEQTLNKINTNVDILEPNFVHFLFKKNGEHMINEKHGRIEIGTPMYDIKIKMTQEEFNRFTAEYGSLVNR
jgi:hypothetical protein